MEEVNKKGEGGGRRGESGKEVQRKESYWKKRKGVEKEEGEEERKYSVRKEENEGKDKKRE